MDDPDDSEEVDDKIAEDKMISEDKVNENEASEDEISENKINQDEITEDGINEDEEFENDKKLVLERCVEYFNLPDFIMDPEVFGVLETFAQCDGEPEQAINLLTGNYHALAQMCNLMCQWWSDLSGGDRQKVYNSITSVLSNLIEKYFQPELADSIFETQGDSIQWLSDLITYRPWRQLIYSLSERYPNCLMLNFAVRLISDAGFQSELTDVSTASQQLDVFSGIVLSTIESLLKEHQRGPLTESYENALSKLVRIVCHSEHTYLYTQAILHVVCEEETGSVSAACAHISQALRMRANGRDQDTSALHIALGQSREEKIALNVLQALHTMMSKQCLNPADVTQLYQQYVSSDPPPVELIREYKFIVMLIESLFAYEGNKINVSHRPKYVYLLAYASCVTEEKTESGRAQNRQELDKTQDAIERVISLLEEKEDLLKGIKTLLTAIEVPVIAAGLLHFIRGCLLSGGITNEPDSVHYVIIDQIATSHPCLQARVFDTLCELYDRLANMSDSASEIIVRKQRCVMDRFVHLLSVGFVLPVVEKMYKLFRDGQTDTSLIRYFALEVLEITSPPYSEDFIRAFSPIISTSEIFDQCGSAKVLTAKEFMDRCAIFRTSPNRSICNSLM